MKKKRKKKKIIILASIFILLLILSTPLIYLHSKLSKIKTVNFNYTPQQLGIKNTTDNSDDQFINILILGIDKANVEDVGRSDCTMILTIDKKHNKIKLTSLMRDMIVDATGRNVMAGLNQDRLNHMYNYGGPLLSVKTVNENFDMNIKDYIKTDFWGLCNIIDYVGGVQINVQQNEIAEINGGQAGMSSFDKKSYTKVTHAGVQTLNGRQAVAYARIRHVGDEDFQRTERDRTVLTDLITKLSQLPITKIPSAADVILPNVETSLSKADMYSLASYILLHKTTSVEQLRLPTDELGYTEYVRNTYFLGWKKPETIALLHKFIYDTN